MFTFDNPVALLIGMLLILTAVVVLLILRRSKITSSTLQAAVDALTPYIYRAIIAGERLALAAMTDFDKQLDGTDKKKVADSVYDALPDYLVVGGFPMPIKAVKWLVPREQFEVLVKNTYEEAHVFILRNENYLQSQISDVLQPGQDSIPDVPTPDPGVPPNSGGFVLADIVSALQNLNQMVATINMGFDRAAPPPPAQPPSDSLVVAGPGKFVIKDSPDSGQPPTVSPDHG